jgi:hypothetical protein
MPSLAETTGICGQTFVAHPQCLAPMLDETTEAPKLACPQCLHPCGTTAIWLAVDNSNFNKKSSGKGQNFPCLPISTPKSLAFCCFTQRTSCDLATYIPQCKDEYLRTTSTLYHLCGTAILDVDTLALQYYAVKAYTVAMFNHNIIQVTGTRQVKHTSRFK